jgi:hypothetical protein
MHIQAFPYIHMYTEHVSNSGLLEEARRGGKEEANDRK